MKVISKSPVALKDEDLPFIWVNEFDGKVATDFAKKIIEFESNPDVKDIFVHIASYGGEIYPLLSMIDMMHNCKKPVHTVCSGFAMSAGGVLLLSGPGMRWMAKNSYLHIHHVRSWSHGDLPEQEQYLKHTKQAENKLFELMAARANITAKGLRDKLQNEQREWRLTPKEALKFGFIDKIGMPSIRKYSVIEYE